jgi:CRP/FNR family transcriptional activator FtrB
MRLQDAERIRAAPLFANLSGEVVRDLAGGAFLHKLPPGVELVCEGDRVDFLCVLFDGKVELSGAWKARETTLAVLQPVSTFGLAAVVLDAPALMTARTVERSEILMIAGESVRRTMLGSPELNLDVARELAGCYRGVVRAIKSQKLRRGVERVAAYLWARRARAGGADAITLPFGKRLIASLLDMTPETLSRALLALGRHGVEVHGHEVAFTRPQALERLVRPSPLMDSHMPAADRPVGKAELERRMSEAPPAPDADRG